jgi:hypothetical protein
MAHAFAGELNSPCIEYTALDCAGFLDHFNSWALEASGAVAGGIGFVSGAVVHLWHGEEQFRRYAGRNYALSLYGFDPNRDLFLDVNGTWRWKRPESDLAKWLRSYFADRQEDGEDIRSARHFTGT